ncbi:MAG: class I SAM-dependent methyltransferase [Lachnospira sp.]|nr:class I SAM-dependent methyltransferase [Lachnospira sp.]
MMHQFRKKMIVISIINHILIEDLVFLEKYRHIYIYSTIVPNKIKMQIGRRHFIEYLDSFLIVLPEDYASQSVIWEDFYTYYGDLYENMIDINNNITCIKKLYSYIQQNISMTSMTKILDYGCGSGLSINIKSNCNMIGYEPNDKMRRQAVEKGMVVLDSEQLYSLSNDYIDAVFSSHVFHMGIKDNDIKILNKIIRHDGIIVANFYKNINCLVVNNAFIRNGFCVKKIIGFDERFGSVYEYRKKR